MPINTCHVCGQQFEAQTKRAKYCFGICVNKKEAAYSCRRYTTFSPARKSASNIVWGAIWRGELTRQPCEVCKTTRKVVAHHDDYAQPLSVRWLCRSHHQQHHRTHGPGLNAFSVEVAA